MASDALFPTKTRLALLRAVRDGDVVRDEDGHDYNGRTWRRVDARMAELARVRWARLPEGSSHGRRVWRLADEGRRVLDEAEARHG